MVDSGCSADGLLGALAIAVVGVAGCHRTVHDQNQPLILVVRIDTRGFCGRIAIIVISKGSTVGTG